MSNRQLQAGDIFLTRGVGLLSKIIRFCTRHIGESRTKVNHVGLVVAGGTVADSVVVEALASVYRHRLVDEYGDGKTHVAVYRPLNLSADEIHRIVRKAESYVGRRYGYLKLLLHLLDWLLQGAYVFRRLGRMDRFPICSWLVAHAYAAAGKSFGVAPGAASPDDIWDFAVTNTEKYQVVRSLSPLGKEVK